MTPLTLAQAQALIAGSLAAARRQGFKPLGVVDGGREDVACALRLDIVRGKAAAATHMGTSSRALAARAKNMPVFFGNIATNAQHPFITQTGAVLVVDETHAVRCASGALGGTGGEDEQIVQAGIAAAGSRAL